MFVGHMSAWGRPLYFGLPVGCPLCFNCVKWPEFKAVTMWASQIVSPVLTGDAFSSGAGGT